MKNFIVGSALFFLTLAAVSCNKEQNAQESSPTTATTTTAARPDADGGSGIFNLNRGKGRRKHGGQEACGCNRCFGVCWAMDDGGDENRRNVIMQNVGYGQMKLYILSQPDEDATVDPTFYIDDEVVMTRPTGNLTFKVGQYPYSSIAGTVVYQGKNYPYYGTTVVNFE